VSNEEHYSDFLNQLSGISREISLFCGFTFTIITLLVTRLTDPSDLISQISLLFLTVLLNLFIFLMGWVMTMRTIFCRYLPFKSIRGSKVFNPLLFLAYCLWGVAVVLIFLLSNLIYLALASIIVWSTIVIISYFFLWSQFWEYYKKNS
jgi:hypothetical protein